MWAFTIKNKVTAALLLFSVLCLVMLTNLQEQRMVKRINKAVTSIYEDRLVVGNYILSLSNHIQEVLSILNGDENRFSQEAIDFQLKKIETINHLYEKTILTENEKVSFETFQTLCTQIKQNNKIENKAQVLELTHKADNLLKELSFIQVEEGKSKLDEVLGMTNTSNILSYFEIVVLIVIAALIQVLVLSSKTILAKSQNLSNHNLN